MDLEPRNLFVLLLERSQDDTGDPLECLRLLSTLNSTLIEEQQNSSLLDLYLIHMFDKSHGLLNFISNTLNKKIYKNSIVKILEILYTFVNNFHKKLEKYVISLNDICMKIVKCSLTSADEKCKSLDLLSLSFERIDKCLEFEGHYADLYRSLWQCSKLKKSDTVQEKLFIALGSFVKKFPYILNVNEHQEQDLKRQFITQLDIEMVKKDISNRVVSGIFTGFAGYCESFPLDPQVEEDKNIINKLYKHIERLAVPQGHVKIGNRAAFTFLTSNMSLFRDSIQREYKIWHNLLLSWLNMGSEERKVGKITIEAYYRGLATNSNQEMSLYFLNYFEKNIRNNNNSNIEKHLSLRGLCIFSGVYYDQLEPQQVTDLFIMILQDFEQNYILRNDVDDDQLEYLPDYIQTISKLMRFKKISSSELFCIQRGVINMIKTFPKLPYSLHYLVIEALVTTIHNFKMNNEELCGTFIDNVIYQGVVWTCSHQHLSEVELNRDNEKVITVKNYLPLWRGLLRIKPMTKFDQFEIYLPDRDYIVVKIIDKLIKTLLMLINKLNVTIIPHDTHLTNIQSAYKVEEIDDFAIFLNVVDFYQMILIDIDPRILRKCVYKIINHLIMKCVRYPYISGFYKLLSLILRISNDLHDDANRDFDCLSKFLEILLVKIDQFKDDLLISCLQVLLEYPIRLIQDVLSNCTSVFVTIFNLGRTYTPIVESALDTLERWQKSMDKDDFDAFLIDIVPVLDSYLLSKSLGGSSSIMVGENRRKTAQVLKKRKVLIEIEPELLRLQKRILDFIGRLDSSLCLAFVSKCDDQTIDLAVWGDKDRLRIVLPYEDKKVELYLDKFLPRIVHLALNCSDRKTRITSCELLQAIVMVFLGTTKQMDGSGQSDLDELLRHLASSLLKLGCDLDQLVQDIFRPLFFQLIHWYTHVSQIGSGHSAIIIESVLVGITHPTDSSLRDFSGKCINEFVKWTIKQSADNRLERDPLHFKMLAKKMRFFSTHPDYNKKMGAALIFNNIYKEIREQRILLSMFWLEYLHIFVKSLALMDNHSEEDVAIDQINLALDHIQRGFVEKSSLFNKIDRNRRVPNDFQGGTLKDVSLWILKQTGAKSLDCRTKSMELFVNIAAKVENVKNPQDFIIKTIENDDWIIDTYYDNNYVKKHPTLSTLLPTNDSSILLKWLKALLALIDGLNFVINYNLFKVKSILNRISIDSIDYFIKNIASTSIEGALNLIKVQSWSFTSFQKRNFAKFKFLITVAIFKLFNCNSYGLYTKDVWDLIVKSIFNPETIGFDDNSRLNREIFKFLKNLPENYEAQVIQQIDCYINDNDFTDFIPTSYVKLKERNVVNGLLILQSWHLKNFKIEKFATGLVYKLIKSISIYMKNGVIYADDLHDTTLNHCLSILEFALSHQGELRVFVNSLYVNYQVQCSDNTKPINFALYVLNLFESVVITKFLENFELFLNEVEKSHNMPRTVEILTYVFTSMLRDKKYSNFYEYSYKNLMNNWGVFGSFFKEDTNRESGLNFIKLIHPLIKRYNLQNGDVKIWLIDLLRSNKDCEIQSNDEDLDTKIDIFTILIDILDEDDHTDQLSMSLDHFELKYFCEYSDLLRKDRQIAYLEKLQSLIPKIKSSELVMVILKISTLLSHYCSDIEQLLSSFISKCANQEIILKKFYGLCENREFSENQQYDLITKALIPLFQWCKLDVFERFYIDTIPDLISILKDSRPNGENLVKRIQAFILFQLLFGRLQITTKDEPSPIARVLFDQNKDFIQLVVKNLLNVPKEHIDVSNMELLRLYRCHSYNALVSVVTNSLKSENFYSKLFERLDTNGKDILWRGLIDTSKVYKFDHCFDSIPQKRKVLVNIRSSLNAQRQINENPKYLLTQRIYNSSLSEDLTKFDFTHTTVRSQIDCDRNRDETQGLSEIELESIDVDQHECIPIVRALIVHMIDTEITNLPKENENYAAPFWIKSIRDLLLDTTTPSNVKIFWIKVIDHEIQIFLHFSKDLLQPLLKFVVDKCAGDSINYFVADVVSVLASWAKLIQPTTDDEKQLLSQLLHFLITNLHNDRQDIFKYHLELIKLIIEAWKSSITVSHIDILAKLDGGISSKRIEVGVHLASVFLANDLRPWGSDLPKFCMRLFEIVGGSTRKSIYKPTAETIGLTLNCLKRDDNFGKILKNVHTMVKKIQDFDKYGYVLEAISFHYPEIVDDFHTSKIFSKIQSLSPDLQIIFMKVMLKRADFIANHVDFKSENWCTYLESSKLEIQILTLEIVHKTLNSLKDTTNFPNIIDSVRRHSTNTNVMCRSLMCDVAIEMCSMNDGSDAFTACRDILLQGLVDGDSEIREKVLDFWENQSNIIPSSVISRFSHILTDLYKPSTENNFLGYVTYLMLSCLKNVDSYKDQMFEYPLDKCDFEQLILQANWRRRHLSVLPMFAETLTSSNEDLDLSRSDLNQLRQTQSNLTFKPTQSITNQFTSSQSSLFIKTDDFVNPNTVLISHKYKLPKKRFLMDRSRISREMAQYQVKKSIENVEKRYDLAKKNDNEVAIFRSYRIGDLPDVQIPLSDLLAPLQALALYDPDTSKTLFLALFKSLVGKTGRDSDFTAKIYEGIKNVFNNSIQYNTNLFRALFDVILECKDSMFFDPNDIKTMSQSSGLITVGILLLEEYLIANDAQPSSSKRNRGGCDQGEATFWVKLAELYKEIDEWDMVKSIFSEKLDCKESVQSALSAESRKKWRVAQDYYNNLLQDDSHATEIKKDFYYESYFKCLAHMGQWDQVETNIEEIVGENCWNRLWDDDWNRQKVLPWFMNSKLKQALFTQSPSDDFFVNLNEILNSNEHYDHLQHRYSEELSMLWLFKKEIDIAKQHVTIYLNNFLESWQLLDPAYTNLRYNKLLQLRNIVDINRFIQVFEQLTVDYDLSDVIKYWKQSTNENLPSILHSETRALYRSEFITLLVEKLKSFDCDDRFRDVMLDLAKLKFTTDFSLIDTAINEDNFYLARKYIRNYESKDLLSVKLTMSRLAYVKSNMTGSHETKIDLILNSVDTLKPCLEENGDLDLCLAAHLQLFNNLREISSIMGNDPSLTGEKLPLIRKQIGDFEDLALLGADRVKDFIAKYEPDLIARSMDSDKVSNKELANVYTQLAYFAKNQNRKYFTNFILFVLKAMKLDSSEARQLFPCILMEILDFDEKTIFLRESEDVPIWMFCAWIPQLLVQIDSANITPVAPIILKIAKTYPQAIMYAYRLSKENFNYQNDTINPEINHLIQELDSLLLGDEKIDIFLKSLCAVCVPAVALSHYIAKLMKACSSKNLDQIRTIQTQIISEVFDDFPDSDQIDSMKGNMYKKIGEFKPRLEDVFKGNIRFDVVLNKLKQIYDDLDGLKRKGGNSKLLKDYCPWLANLSADKLNLDLEIPGQYHGNKMPLVQFHAKIAGFHPNVCDMNSLRKPIKVTILGNDTKEYPFLIKFGEDIRQDQRIQQLLTLMNGLLSNHKELSIVTYQVIPLTTNLGMIQWVNDTKSLEEFIEKPLIGEIELKRYKSIPLAYNNFIFGRSKKNTIDGYGTCAVQKNRDKVIPNYRSLVNCLPMDILRQSFWKLSANTESFFSLRTNFIKSYAVMCATHWLLGIGDRHLCNSKICLKTGKVLGIDFGHAFGTATQILPVPELIPFRLTPHITAFMEPIGERGLFRDIMVQTLRLLRDHKQSLLATMNVFIQEPSLDWLENAGRNEEIGDKEWFPLQKIQQAEMKLNGANSVTVMIGELNLGQKRNKDYMEAYIRLVQGDREFDFRARKPLQDLSPEDQVDCLIDHATDYNLLGRMYAGWSPWV